MFGIVWLQSIHFYLSFLLHTGHNQSPYGYFLSDTHDKWKAFSQLSQQIRDPCNLQLKHANSLESLYSFTSISEMFSFSSTTVTNISLESKDLKYKQNLD
jgi:hypothetical protein